MKLYPLSTSWTVAKGPSRPLAVWQKCSPLSSISNYNLYVCKSTFPHPSFSVYDPALLTPEKLQRSRWKVFNFLTANLQIYHLNPPFLPFPHVKGIFLLKLILPPLPLGSLPSCFSKGQASLLLAPFPEVFEHAHHSRFTKTKPPNPIHFSFTYCPFPLTVTISSKILSLAFMCPASFPPLMTPFQPLYSSLDCCHSTPGQSVTTYIFMNPKFVLKPLLLVSLSQLLPGEPVTGLHIMIY